MAVVPESAGLLGGGEGVKEAVVGRNGALVHKRGTCETGWLDAPTSGACESLHTHPPSCCSSGRTRASAAEIRFSFACKRSGLK
jgi:hypothetical protein